MKNQRMDGVINIVFRYVFFSTLGIICLAHKTNAAPLYSRVSSGDWTNTTTWSYSSAAGATSCGCTPGVGDVVNIKTGQRVILDSDFPIGTSSSSAVTVTIVGTLEITNNGRLTLPAGSRISGGTLDYTGNGNGNNAKLVIGTTTVWRAGDGDKSTFTYSDTPLPIELLYFNVKYSNEKVLITWATAQELNNKTFEVEKSYDGITFYTIKQVNGHGTTSSLNTYQTEDADLQGKIIYYRLKQIDNNGDIEIFKIKSVTLNAENEMVLYPNPSQSNGKIYVELIDIDTNLETVIELIDKHGQVIYSKVCTDYDGGYYFIVLPGGLNGYYILKASNNQQVYQKKILII